MKPASNPVTRYGEKFPRVTTTDLGVKCAHCSTLLDDWLVKNEMDKHINCYSGKTSAQWRECPHGNPLGMERCADCRHGMAQGYARLEQEKVEEAAQKRRRLIDSDHIVISPNAPQTSQNAATLALPRAGTKRRIIYQLIQEAGAKGLCDHEIEELTGWLHQSASSIRNGLMNDNLVKDSGIKRNTRQGNPASAWIISL
jgi:hypothetical protein